jgi:hypothetical protein
MEGKDTKRRFLVATLGWRAGILASALLAILAAGTPAGAANTNLTATAKYLSSSDWESDIGNTAFVAAKAFDGDYTTRWNSGAGDLDGSWLAADWDTPVTINRVVMHEAIGRINAFRVQRRDAGSQEWQDVYVAEGDKYTAIKGGTSTHPVFNLRLTQPVQTAGLRVVFDSVTNVPSIYELEAFNNPAGTVTGTVTDPTGKPIEGVTIRAGAESTTTSAEGKYTLVADAGRYDVIAAKQGAFRERRARGTELPANGTVTRDFVLQPLPPNLARTATAVSSSDWEDGEDFNAAKANDGNLTTRWNARAEDTAGSWLEMRWTQPQTFNQVTVRESNGRIRNYSLQRYDKASDAYVNILTADAPPGTGDRVYTQLLATPVTSERLRMLINVTDDVPSIWELEVANAPVATVNAVVKDVASGNPVPRATITNDLGVVLGTTNDQGQINLLVEPDDYVVNASAEGYLGGAPVSFTINAGETQEVTIALPALGANIARTGKAAASSENESAENPAALAFDADPATFWLAQEYANQWVGVTWDQPTRFTVVQLEGFKASIGRSYLQMLAEDGTTWVDVPNTVIAPEHSGRSLETFLFPAGITTKGIRYYITATDSTANIPGLSEFRVFNSPIPAPAP